MSYWRRTVKGGVAHVVKSHWRETCHIVKAMELKIAIPWELCVFLAVFCVHWYEVNLLHTPSVAISCIFHFILLRGIDFALFGIAILRRKWSSKDFLSLQCHWAERKSIGLSDTIPIYPHYTSQSIQCSPFSIAKTNRPNSLENGLISLSIRKNWEFIAQISSYSG